MGVWLCRAPLMALIAYGRLDLFPAVHRLVALESERSFGLEFWLVLACRLRSDKLMGDSSMPFHLEARAVRLAVGSSLLFVPDARQARRALRKRLRSDETDDRMRACSTDQNEFGSETGGRGMAEQTREELLARIAELERQAGSKRKGSLEFRVGEKGGVSVYGLGRFPVTLYYEQWIRLLELAGDLRKFLEENKSKLKLKTQE